MTAEDKELLLKDLCARLPYEVIVDYSYNAFDGRTHGQECILDCDLLDTFISPRLDEEGEYIKPYLFPLSSMTEEQRQEAESLAEVIKVPMYGEFLSPTPKYYDWLNKNYFDYRGLIPKGLAIDATGLNIY